MEQRSFGFVTIKEMDAVLQDPAQRERAQQAQSVLAQLFVSVRDPAWISQAAAAVQRLGPHVVVVGTTSSGEICAGKVSMGSNVLSLTFFDKSSLLAIHHACEKDGEIPVAQSLVDALEHCPSPPKGLLLLATPDSMDCGALLSEISRLAPNVPVYGGGAAYEDFGTGGMYVFSSTKTLRAGVVAVALCGDDLDVLRHTYLGWMPIGKRMRITSAERFRIHAIDHRPAFDVYRHYLGIEADDHFSDNAQEFPFLINRNGHVIARVPSKVLKDGSIEFIADVQNGEEISFGYGHIETILAQVSSTERAIRDFAPQAIHLYACSSRRLLMQQDIQLEVTPFQRIAATTGFFTHGEFCNAGAHSPLLNCTLVIAAMRERQLAAAIPSMEETRPADADSLYSHRHARILARFQHFTRAITDDLEFAKRELEVLADHDSLTGLANRRVLNALMSAEFLRHQRYSHRRFCVVVCDVDHFKRINDRFGHPVGDTVLKTLAHTLQKEARASDTVCRHGGEEFVVFMPETGIEAATACAERMRRSVESLAMQHEGVKLPTVSMSFGVSGFPQDGQDATALLSAADGMLYEAKRAGRNRVRSTAGSIELKGAASSESAVRSRKTLESDSQKASIG